jgi:hypothetical protein
MFKRFLPILLILAACNTAPVRHIAESPAVTVSEAGKVEVTGDAQAPSKVDTKKTDSKLPLPEGSRLEFNEKLGIFSITLSKASEIALNRTETAVQGPVSFTPDKGPTVGEEAQAKADYWTTLGLRAGVVFGIAAALFGLVRHWDLVMYGGGTIAVGCLFGLFIQKHPVLLIIIGIGAALAGVGPILWHGKIKKLANPKETTSNGENATG